MHCFWPVCAESCNQASGLSARLPCRPRIPRPPKSLPPLTARPAACPLQLVNIETTKSQQHLFAALKEGNAALKEMQQVGGAFFCKPCLLHVRAARVRCL